MFGVTIFNLMVAASLFNPQESEAIPHRKAPPKLSPLALQILYSHGGVRDQITHNLRNTKKLVKLESVGIEKTEVENLIFYLSDRELFILQKVFLLSFGADQGFENEVSQTR